jgi:RND superfamily putative drug exporter
MLVTPTTGPSDDATTSLIHTLRDDVLPKAVVGTPIDPSRAYVTGTTAVVVDFAAQVQSRMLLFFGAVLALTFVLLMMVFRSLFVPVKAVIMNLLSIGASFGVLVLIFQEGWGSGMLGIGEKVPIVVFVPIVMFAVLFGLSMDYEVFLLSRIREEYQKTGDSAEAVVSGLANTARVITSAAMIMIFVFLAGATNPAVPVKMLGLGMAVAVLVDATIVRMILVPSSMELMGKANWWLPRWIDKILPHINVD